MWVPCIMLLKRDMRDNLRPLVSLGSPKLLATYTRVYRATLNSSTYTHASGFLHDILNRNCFACACKRSK